MRTVRIGSALAALALAGLAAGCGASDPAPAPSPSRSAGAADLRHFDFGTAAWHHPFLNDELRAHTAPGDHTVRLAAGRATVASGPNAPVRCRLSGSPVYGDIGGGTPSAAVALSCEAGTGDSTAWYVWRWDATHHTARQSAEPIAADARCGDAVDSVTYSAHTFVVAAREFDPAAATSCADAKDARRPARYAVAVRAGYLQRVSAPAGSVRECRFNAATRHVTGPVTLYATRDTRSPVVLRDAKAVKVLTAGPTDYYEQTTDLGGAAHRRWQFVRVDAAGGAYHCGYRIVTSG